MFKHLSEFVIRIVDLAEAEGRQLRAIVAKMGLGFALVLLAVLLAVVGFGLVVFALFVWLRGQLGPAPAALITGLVALALAALLASIGAASLRQGGPKP